MNVRRRLVMVALTGLVAAVGGVVSATAASAAPPAGPAAGPRAVGGFYQVINKRSNKCVAPRANSALPQARIVQRGCEPRVNHRWALHAIGNGYHWLSNQGSGYCLDLFANSEEEVVIGTRVQQFPCSLEYTSEQWRLVPAPAPSGHYLLQTRIHGLCLDVLNASTANDAPLQVIECKPYEPAQHFRFV
ncbi:MAG TPA: RICIN domain-containing protein [Pilimelia sp.]|nr:RICIN domain-containing protein [Pilimelia sp.]